MPTMDAKSVAHESLYGDGQPNDVYMNVTRYMADADRTASGGIFHEELVPAKLVLDAIEEVRLTNARVDAIKKALFYGKEDADLAFAAKLNPPGGYDKVALELIHSILGIYTEAAELMELLGVTIITGEVDEAKLVNEAGDGLWYHSLLYKFLGTDFDEVAQKNIAKLRQRFPVKFTEDLAVNRDEAQENFVFE